MSFIALSASSNILFSCSGDVGFQSGIAFFKSSTVIFLIVIDKAPETAVPGDVSPFKATHIPSAYGAKISKLLIWTKEIKENLINNSGGNKKR